MFFDSISIIFGLLGTYFVNKNKKMGFRMVDEFFGLIQCFLIYFMCFDILKGFFFNFN